VETVRIITLARATAVLFYYFAPQDLSSGWQAVEIPAEDVQTSDTNESTKQDMRTKGGFHVLEVHMASGLKGGTQILLLIGAAIGAYLMARVLKRKALAREQLRVACLEMRMEPGPDRRGLQAPSVPPVVGVVRPGLGFVPIA
jgi:hypothetical protein